MRLGPPHRSLPPVLFSRPSGAHSSSALPKAGARLLRGTGYQTGRPTCLGDRHLCPGLHLSVARVESPGAALAQPVGFSGL